MNRILMLSKLLAFFGLAMSNGACDDKPAPAKDFKPDPSVPRYSKSGYDVTPLTEAQLEPLVAKLTPEERHITQDHGTEPKFCGGLLKNKEAGTYVCVTCGLPLFTSEAKFESGTGWPSFFQPFDPAHIREIEDNSYGMHRVEIRCARSDSHLGHVFDDGPEPTGLRYCLNSAALRFIKSGDEVPPESRPVEARSAYFAGGCFWGVEDVFQQIPGVMDAVSGYMGGTVDRPNYKLVCTGDTGHAETVKVVFDPKRVSYAKLLDVFFKNHDATTLNRQGPDWGTQYRSAIYAADDAQLAQAKEFIETLGKTAEYEDRPIVTQVEKAPTFFAAEDYHQDYHAKHGGSCRVKR